VVEYLARVGGSFVRLEQANVEHVMYAHCRGQDRYVGYKTHTFADLEGPIESRTKLVAIVDAERGDQSVEQPQPHPVPHREH
jgi:hypothetical protein